MLEHFRTDWENIVRGMHHLEKIEYIKYRRSLPNLSMRGEYVKSYGEKLIADFLFEHNLSYKYEKNHWWNGLNYRPDFTLFITSNSGLVVEYFGLAGDSDYDSLTEEKRNFWRFKQQWKLLEVTPADISGGRDKFFFNFKQLLEMNGVSCTALSEDEVWRRIKDRAIDGFTSAAVGFIQRCRKLSLTPSELRSLINSKNNLSCVESKFLEIAQYLYDAYLNRLLATNEEDFDGLMQKAVKYIQEGSTIFERKNFRGDLRNIRYMLIDEYQDFSDLFFRLVKAVQIQNDKIEFFCVGDDWQAINGFAGSDLKFYENFQCYFSPSCVLYLSTNYRSSKSIVGISNALMEGLGKPAEAYKSDHGMILLGDLQNFTPSNRENERHAGDIITPAVLRLVSKLLSAGKNVVLMSRKNTLPWYINYNVGQFRKVNGLDTFCDLICSFFPDEMKEKITTSTTHKYKGLQNDAVIVLDAVYRCHPLIHPDWIFTRVLGDDIEKIISEEKRLFYVALTRAVDTLIILTEYQSSSPFLSDIISKLTLKRVNWDNYPPVKNAISLINVRVGNLNPHNNSATYSIRDKLKASGYRWDSINKVWQKSFIREDFTLENLQNTIWSQMANEISVHIIDDNTIVGEYAIHSGQWHSVGH